MIIFLLCILIHFSIMSSGLSNEFHQYSPMLKDAINNCSITEAKNIADKSIQDVRNIIDNLKLDKKTVQDLTDYAFSLFYQLGRLHMTNELSNRVQTQPQKTLKSNTNPSIANQNLQSLLTQYAKGCSGLKKTGFCLLGIIVFGSLLYSGVSLYAFGKQKYFDWKRKNTTD